MSSPLDRTANGQRRLNEAQLALIVRRVEVLPTRTGLAGQLMDLAIRHSQGADAGATLAEAGSLIRLDPALSARLLAMASAEVDRPVATVREAVDRLEHDAILPLLWSPPVRLDAPARNGEMTHAGLWKHSLAVALAAEQLARAGAGPANPEEAFTCGLLHDLGKLAMQACMPKSYARATETARLRRGNLSEYETRLIGTNHAVFGRRLADHWRLARGIVEVIWLHHQPVEALPRSLHDAPMVSLVGLADLIARQLGLGVSGNHAMPRTPEEVAGQLDLPRSIVAEIARDLPDRLDRASAACCLDAPDNPAQFQRTMLRANEALARDNRRLARRADRNECRLEGLSRIGHLASHITPESSVPEVLAVGLEVLSPPGAPDGSDGELVIYSIEGETGEVLAARGGDETAWRALPGQAEASGAPPVKTTPTGTVLSSLLAEPGDLTDWIDAGRYRHHPLEADGRWVGGVFCPGALAWTNEDAGGVVSEMLGAVLSIVQSRSRAMAMGEQLAGASELLAETQESLAESKTLSAVGQMAAGAAHEMNNPLAVIAGRAQLMRERATSESDRQTWRLIAEQSQRVSDLISDLMEFASPPQARPGTVDIGTLFNHVAEAFSTGAAEDPLVEVDITNGDRLPPVWADESQVLTVLKELVANAVTATERRARVRLSAEADELHRAVVLSVRDDGPGMDEQTLAKACIPFFSLQQAGRRRGLGLPRAKRLVECNRGKLWLHSVPGEGTTVFFQLPIACNRDRSEGEQTDERTERNERAGRR
jgi:putative nucleotidyltransferase with HDIG domain